MSQRVLWLVALVGSVGTMELSAEGLDASASNPLPEPLNAGHFDDLLQNSPFTRPLNLYDTLVLTGVAVVDGGFVATLMDTEDGRSIAVSDMPNQQGWSVVEVQRMEHLDRAIARIAVTGGEVIQVRHDLDRIRSTAQRLRFKAKASAQMAAARARARQGAGSNAHGVPSERVAMLKKIEQSELPKGYNPGAGRNAEEAHRLHQSYVDRRLSGMSQRQRGQVGQLWGQKQAVEPSMSNRGASFVRILEHVAENEPR